MFQGFEPMLGEQYVQDVDLADASPMVTGTFHRRNGDQDGIRKKYLPKKVRDCDGDSTQGLPHIISFSHSRVC